jgi:hypothetical protein
MISGNSLSYYHSQIYELDVLAARHFYVRNKPKFMIVKI